MTLTIGFSVIGAMWLAFATFVYVFMVIPEERSTAEDEESDHG